VSGITIAGLSKTYRGGQVKALDQVSLEIHPGEAFGIIGPNGAGKTTLVGCLLGLLRPDSGTIALDGMAPDDLAVKRVTGYLPERLVLDRWMTGAGFLAYHHALAGLPAATRRADCEAAFARVGLEAAAGAQRVARYSRGMLQRLGFAQALLGSPRLLFLDEPISGVDPAGVMLFRRILGELAASGATVILNSHQLAEVERVCTRVVFVQQGRITSTSTVRAGAAEARVLRVRLSAHAGMPDPARLAEIAAAAGAGYRATAPPDARFSVADDAGATRLLAALLAAGVPVVEAGPEEGRLERLFTAPGGGGR